MTELIECGCHTRARRHPSVLGRVGTTVLPFQIKAPSFVAGVGTFGVVLWSWMKVWGHFVPPVLAFIIIIGVPLVAARAAAIASVGGRNPFLTVLGVVRYVFRCRQGVVDGRPYRRPSARRQSSFALVVRCER
jgi:hypothetical protein